MTHTLLLLMTLLMCSNVHGTIRNDVPNCDSVLDAPKGVSVNRELFLVVDRTMVNTLDQTIKRDIYNHVQHYLRSGDRLQLIEFSSVQGGAYTQVAFSGNLDPNLNSEQRYTSSKSQIQHYQRCQQQQRQYLLRQFGLELKAVFHPLPSSPNTEIVASLKDISRELIAPSTANHKTLLLISDMLENSDVTSFYRRGKPRQINVEREIGKFARHNMKSTLANTNVYIIGLGLMENSSDYLSPTLRQQYADFWRRYVEISGGRVQAIGQPNLLGGL